MKADLTLHLLSMDAHSIAGAVWAVEAMDHVALDDEAQERLFYARRLVRTALDTLADKIAAEAGMPVAKAQAAKPAPGGTA